MDGTKFHLIEQEITKLGGKERGLAQISATKLSILLRLTNSQMEHISTKHNILFHSQTNHREHIFLQNL